MQTIIAKNHLGEKLLDETYLDDNVAQAMFSAAIHCIDCGYAVLLDGMTGEVLADWDKENLTFYNFDDAKILRHFR